MDDSQLFGALALPCRSKRENKLVDSQPKALYHPLPVLFVTAVLGSEKKSVRQSLIAMQSALQCTR